VDGLFAAWFTLNGNGEMTGTTWIEESGLLGGPVMITNTHSVGIVHAATIEYAVNNGKDFTWSLPVVAETWDGGLNDINGFHVTKADAHAALAAAKGGPVLEGNVGGGTGMTCHQFKGGTGTSSRRITVSGRQHTLGVLVQCNYGGRSRFSVAGAPVGEEITDLLPCAATPDTTVLRGLARCGAPSAGGGAEGPADDGDGSIIIVIATDAPLLPHQLKRIATRASLGVGRSGGRGENSSGDIFVAFSTANAGAAGDAGTIPLTMLPNARINPLFTAAVQATEEAILNAMLAAETMTGANDLRIHALPHDRLLAALRKYGRVPTGQ